MNIHSTIEASPLEMALYALDQLTPDEALHLLDALLGGSHGPMLPLALDDTIHPVRKAWDGVSKVAFRITEGEFDTASEYRFPRPEWVRAAAKGEL